MKITENDMLGALWRFGRGTPEDRWCFIPQVGIGDPEGRATVRRIDMLGLRDVESPRLKDSTPFESLAIEVKVCRSDFLADVRKPDKQQPWRDFAHRHAYAVPAGLVEADEVPLGSGLLEVSFPAGPQGSTTVRWVRPAPLAEREDDWTVPRHTLRNLLMRLSSHEARALGWNPGLRAQDGLQDSLDSARDELAALELDRGRWRTEWLFWRGLLSQAYPEGATCETCGDMIQPLGAHKGWEHHDETKNERCRQLYAEKLVAQAKDDYNKAGSAERDLRRDAAMAKAMGRNSVDGTEAVQREMSRLHIEPWRTFMSEVSDGAGPAIPTQDMERRWQSERPVWFGLERYEFATPEAERSVREIREVHLQALLYVQVRETLLGLKTMLGDCENEKPEDSDAVLFRSLGAASRIGYENWNGPIGLVRALTYVVELEDWIGHDVKPAQPMGPENANDFIYTRGLPPLPEAQITGRPDRLLEDLVLALPLAAACTKWAAGMEITYLRLVWGQPELRLVSSGDDETDDSQMG